MTVELQQGHRFLERFTLIRRLGEGGMSEVWLAQDDELREQVALKILKQALSARPEMIALLRNECKSARRLVHPAIVRTHGFYTDGDVNFLSMEYLDGGDFRRFIGTPYTEYLPRLLPIVDALEYAHDNAVVHRDIKPGNILCNRTGQALLADFGIAAILEHDEQNLQIRGGGSPYSASPQQLDRSAPQPADDLYGLGVLLYEMINGSPPFYPDISADKVRTHMPPPPAGEAPQMLTDLCMELLAKQPADRPGDMGEVTERLRTVLSTGSNATLPPDILIKGGEPGGRRFESIEPEPFRSLSTDIRQIQPQGTPLRLWVGAAAALGVLLLLALLVFVVLPGTVEAPTKVATRPSASDAKDVNAAEPDPARPPPSGLTPWDTAQLARDREVAEQVLERLLELQFDLEEKGVKTWASVRFDEARAKAREGDEQFSLREYEAATLLFRDGLGRLRAIKDSMPDLVSIALSEAWRAYTAADTVVAAEQFAHALAIDPANAQARRGLERTKVLPQVLANMKAAVQSESNGELQAALEGFREAAKLDTDYVEASQAVERVTTRIGNRRFNDAMSRAYVALEQKSLGAARAAFAEAAKLSPGSAAARDGLAQVELQSRLGDIGGAQAAAAAAVGNEEWDVALEKFKAVLAIDPSVVFARQGAEQASQRSALNKALQTFIARPERLGQDDVLADAQKTLVRADAISDRGPRLTAQMQELARLVAAAKVPVSVQLVSDNNTSVTVFKVDRLGKFSARELRLRPGTYTAVGTRDGYRDVRRQFTLSPGENGQTVVVQCEEKI